MFRKLMTVVGIGVLVTPASAQELWLLRGDDLLRSKLQLAASEYQLELMMPTMLYAQKLLTAVQPTMTVMQTSLQTMAPSLAVMSLQLGTPSGVVEPRDEWFPQDTADALYRRARTEYNRRNYQQAIDYFRQLRENYAQSRYLSQAYFYEASSLYRLNAEASYRQALTLLDMYRDQYSQSWTSNYTSLYTQIQGRLARLGDTDAAAAVAERASCRTRTSPAASPSVSLRCTLSGSCCTVSKPRRVQLTRRRPRRASTGSSHGLRRPAGARK